MKTYQTTEIAKLIEVHPNTVRLYEKWGYIEPVLRGANGYRIYTDKHLKQMKLVRIFAKRDYIKVKYRIQMIDIIKSFANDEKEIAIEQARAYLKELSRETIQVSHVGQKMTDILNEPQQPLRLKRHQVSDLIHVSMDALLDWERNGFVEVERQRNNYRIYTEKEIQKLKVIQVLKANQYGSSFIFKIMKDPQQATAVLLEEVEIAKNIAKEVIEYLEKG